MATDESWEAAARAARKALRCFGRTMPRCLPGEEEACGGTFAEHALSMYQLLIAYAEHQISHMAPPPAVVRRTRENAQAEIDEIEAQHAVGQ